jgi:tetratricopeptide (TPR) repeat protein
MLPLLWIMLSAWSFFDPFHEHVETGNKNAKEGDSSGALEQYEGAAKIDPLSPIPDFNRAVVLSREKETLEAQRAYEAAQASNDPSIAADAHYNLGNLFFNQENYPAAIEQYLRSLDLDPMDADARRNLEIALQEQEQQQQQQQQQDEQQKQDQEQQEQQQQDEGKEDQEQSSQSEKPENQQKDEQQPQASQDEEQQQNPQQQEDSQQQETPEQKPGENELPPGERLSREDAARLLSAIENDELRVLQSLEEKKEEEPGVAANDW